MGIATNAAIAAFLIWSASTNQSRASTIFASVVAGLYLGNVIDGILGSGRRPR